uniref:NOP2/Sun RNA methyltransferase family member 7 n=1 Tax=Sphaeramia orbicularis TaxID=375764 RepID=A0A672YMZ7_9TELE
MFVFENDLKNKKNNSQLGFSDRVYLLASILFQNNYLEKPAAQQVVSYGKERGVPFPEVKDEDMHRTAYELAFNALKYDQMSLVAVMLYDFQDRKFLPREHKGEEEFIKEVRDVENYLLRFKTKLAASLARCRIKFDLLSIECILPESVKARQMRSSNLPLYAWVNPLKGSFDQVCSVLNSAGFVQVKSIGQLKGKTFCQDLHCADMLVFPAQMKAPLYSTKLLSNRKLIIQVQAAQRESRQLCLNLSNFTFILTAFLFCSLSYFTFSLYLLSDNSSKLPIPLLFNPTPLIMSLS